MCLCREGPPREISQRDAFAATLKISADILIKNQRKESRRQTKRRNFVKKSPKKCRNFRRTSRGVGRVGGLQKHKRIRLLPIFSADFFHISHRVLRPEAVEPASLILKKFKKNWRIFISDVVKSIKNSRLSNPSIIINRLPETAWFGVSCAHIR